MKLLSYLLSPIFAIVFFSLLMIFHPLQWIGLKLFGYKGHKFIVDLMVFSIEFQNDREYSNFASDGFKISIPGNNMSY